MKKYKCKACNHLFEGDLSVTACPNCGSEDIKMQSKTPWKKILIAGGVIFAIIIVISIFGSKSLEVKLMLKDDFPIIGKISLEEMSGKISEKELKKYYVQLSESGLLLDKLYFSGKYRYVTYDKNLMKGGETYVFEFLEKKTGKKLGQCVYNCPMPPTPPKIKINSIADCKTGTYTIEIEVEDGNPDVFYLDDIKQQSNTISGVKPKNGVYVVKAYDSVNKLYSAEHRITCSAQGVLSYKISLDVIQQTFKDISQRKIYVGDAMQKITGDGRNVKLSRPIDGCENLEEALNYARTHEILYKVEVEISSDDCFDRIKHITLSK